MILNAQRAGYAENLRCRSDENHLRAMTENWSKSIRIPALKDMVC